MIEAVNCDQANGVCSVRVPAPGAALVFLSDNALSEIERSPVVTYPTTAQTRTHNTATVDPAVLATSNGHSAMNQKGKSLGSTSKGSVSGSADVGGRYGTVFWLSVVMAGVAGPLTMGVAMVVGL